jgi:uncharacterized Fe-S cluster protein YjdI
MNHCDCKHFEYCKVDPNLCKLKDDPWIKPDGKILGRTTKEISKMQGRSDNDLKK